MKQDNNNNKLHEVQVGKNFAGVAKFTKQQGDYYRFYFAKILL